MCDVSGISDHWEMVNYSKNDSGITRKPTGKR